MKTKTNRAAELLAKNVTALCNSETFKRALAFRKSFQTQYSFRNLWLIFLQMPEASMVAGYRKWKEVGRQVKKGQKSLGIFAPITRKNEEGVQEFVGCKTASVFDISQTEGEDVPEIPRPVILESTEDVSVTINALVDFATFKDFSVSFEAVEGSANGFYAFKTRRIVVDDTNPQMQQLKTLVHELAHGMLHAKRDEVAVSMAELEAEATAFLVCDALGLDTSSYSFAYLAGWSEYPEQILNATEKACKAADEVLSALEVASDL